MGLWVKGLQSYWHTFSIFKLLGREVSSFLCSYRSHDGNKESSMGSEGNNVNTVSRAANKNGPGGNQGKKSNNYPKRNNSNAKNHQNKKSANEKSSVENGDTPFS